MKRLLPLAVLLGLMLALPGCAGTPAPAPTPEPEPAYDVLAVVGTEFKLSVGQTTRIETLDVYITFTEVLADNRCPRGAQCIVAGRAEVRLEFTDAAGSEVVDLEHPGPEDHLIGAVWNGHHFEYDVGPFPVVDQPLEPASYYLRLNFTG